MKSTNDRVREQLNATMASSASMLRDNIVTMRNGRYCLPVKQEYKSSFQGMIHDQSATGSTFFIEPMAIVKLNNELAELAMKEQEEIEKILITPKTWSAISCFWQNLTLSLPKLPSLKRCREVSPCSTRTISTSSGAATL